MADRDVFRIAVFEGDGIGPEITSPAIKLLDQVCERVSGVALEYEYLDAGALHYQKTGEALPRHSIERAKSADAVFLSAMGLPHIRKPDGTEITPQIQMRFELDLYAGVRPVRIFEGQPTPLADPRAIDIDFVIVRESTEGLFAYMNDGEIVDNAFATEKLKITRRVSEKLFDFSFRLAQRRARERGRQPRVTCVDKANVFRAFWFFRSIFEERARAFPEIGADAAYVDAFAMWMVQRPWEFDVAVTENMFGDILSDLAAGLMGSLGLAPSADLGDEHGVFQPCHGSAPDIAGKGLANPAAMFLSGAMMLDWLSEKKANENAGRASKMIEAAVGRVIKGGKYLTADLGGDAGTEDFSKAVLDALD